MEMFLGRRRVRGRGRSLLHACGDVSSTRRSTTTSPGFAPRMWRCFLDDKSRLTVISVCSTHVEMFPRPTMAHRLSAGLLHACGDVSACMVELPKAHLFAPRMWRCFLADDLLRCECDVCSTHVEMFLGGHRFQVSGVRLLHACGDVSRLLTTLKERKRFAPRMWRCFCPYHQA